MAMGRPAPGPRVRQRVSRRPRGAQHWAPHAGVHTPVCPSVGPWAWGRGPCARRALAPLGSGGADGGAPPQPQTASSRSCVSSAPASLSKDEDACRFHSTKKGNFHEIFNLTENERPLAGTWASSPLPSLAPRGRRLESGRQLPWPVPPAPRSFQPVCGLSGDSGLGSLSPPRAAPPPKPTRHGRSASRALPGCRCPWGVVAAAWRALLRRVNGVLVL